MGDGEGLDLDGRLACYACGKRHDSAIAKYLPDGTIVGLQSNAFALYCEAQYVLSKRSKEKRREYLERVEKSRGISGKEELQREIMRWHNVQKQGTASGGR